jgi:hypothetical protein
VPTKSNRNTDNKRLSPIDLWLIRRLAPEEPVVLPIIINDYIRERGLLAKAKDPREARKVKRNARRVIERRLKVLEQRGIIERLPTYPISYKLKRLPIEYFAQISGSQKASDAGFDLRKSGHAFPSLVDRLVVSQKNDSSRPSLKILRKMGLRVITRANEYRRQALLRAQNKPSIRPGTTPHADIAYLYKENIRWWENSVLVFRDDLEQYLLMDVRTRFTDYHLVERVYKKARKALENGFSKHEDAIMITLTIPHIFPLVIPLERKGKIIGFIPLQDSIISELKNYLSDWLRQMWKDRKIKTFVAYEYHRDYVLHLHIIIFGIPYLIDWSRKFGRKKEDALTYYSRKYGIELPPEAEKTEISKHIFTALLDKWLIRILTRFGSILKINLREAYINYKKKYNLQGPINEIHRIKDGQWVSTPPKDAVREYSSGAAYREVLAPDRYVTKYVLKIYSMLKDGGGIDEENQAKIYGYWLFGKRFNSYSRSLSPWKKFPKLTKLHFVGVFNKLDLPDYILERVVEW